MRGESGEMPGLSELRVPAVCATADSVARWVTAGAGPLGFNGECPVATWTLEDNLLALVFSFLDANDRLGRAGAVCRRWHAVAVSGEAPSPRIDVACARPPPSSPEPPRADRGRPRRPDARSVCSEVPTGSARDRVHEIYRAAERSFLFEVEAYLRRVVSVADALVLLQRPYARTRRLVLRPVTPSAGPVHMQKRRERALANLAPLASAIGRYAELEVVLPGHEFWLDPTAVIEALRIPSLPAGAALGPRVLRIAQGSRLATLKVRARLPILRPRARRPSAQRLPPSAGPVTERLEAVVDLDAADPSAFSQVTEALAHGTAGLRACAARGTTAVGRLSYAGPTLTSAEDAAAIARILRPVDGVCELAFAGFGFTLDLDALRGVGAHRVLLRNARISEVGLRAVISMPSVRSIVIDECQFRADFDAGEPSQRPPHPPVALTAAPPQAPRPGRSARSRRVAPCASLTR